MRRVFINEEKFKKLVINEALKEYNIADGNAFHNPYKKKIDRGKELLKKLIDVYGKQMISVENGREYMTYEIYALSQTLGVRYCICRLVDNETNKTRGGIFIRPLAGFKEKIN